MSKEIELRRRKAELLKKAREQRASPAAGVEMRASHDGSLTLTGLACRTGVWYELSGFKEMVAPGAFKRSLSEGPDVQLVVNHAMGGQLPLARTTSGTMRLTETSDGLEVEADLDSEDPDAQRLARALRRGDVDGMSFAFVCTNDAWSPDMSERTIRAVSLHRGDVSVCNQGANPAAFATIRSQAAGNRDWKPVDHVARAKEQLAVLQARAEGVVPAKRKPTLSPDEIWSARYRGELAAMKRRAR